jgi:thiamine-phosphate pyrophosphorylase
MVKLVTERVAIPRLYAIVDAQVLAGRGVGLEEFARELRAAGVGLVQYRDKVGPDEEVLRAAEVLREVFAGSGATLILNDRAELAVRAGFDGVHVGQGDLPPEEARRVVDPTSQKRDVGHSVLRGAVVGVSTHTEEQVRAADLTSADYIAIGPVFATGTKADAEPVVGLEGVRRARALTGKPLVAIGGITRANARSVIDAGADSVATISGLFGPGESVAQVARDFLRLLG